MSMLRRTLPNFSSPSSASSSSVGNSNRQQQIIVRLVSINDVYSLANLPRLATFLSSLGSSASDDDDDDDTTSQRQRQRRRRSIRPSAVCLAGDFISPSTLSSIDGGRGHVDTLVSAGITHASLGNHEADVKLPVLRRRISELGRSAVLLNGNVVGWLDDMGGTFNAASSFGQRATAEYDVVSSECGGVRVGLTGLLSDEAGMFRDGTFRGLPIQSVTDRYDEILTSATDSNVLVPLTHQSLGRDLELARHMVRRGLGGVIIGGHEHEPMLELVESEQQRDDDDGPACSSGSSGISSVTIVKTGQNADRAAVIDLKFDPESRALQSVEVAFEDLGGYDPCPAVQRVADRHLQVLVEMENTTVVDVASQLSSYFTLEGESRGGDDDSNAGGEGHATTTATRIVPELSSERSRYRQSTVGALFCQAIKSELEVDVCVINGAPIKASRAYPGGTMSHGDLKEELPFPLKIVVVEMTRKTLREAITYSRTQTEEGGRGNRNRKGRGKDGGDGANAEANGAVAAGSDRTPLNGEVVEVERRGYLQTDFDYILEEEEEGGGGGGGSNDDEVVLVALPRNLMGGFCKIRPLMDLGKDMKARGKYPEKDDYMKAIDLIVRFCCKERWANVVDDCENNAISFEDIDLNKDGVLDREEVRHLMRRIMGVDPGSFLVEDMIDAIDTDHDGFVSQEEFEQLLEMVKERRSKR